MLRYSDAALAVRPTFFASRADIIVIVEDMGKENFYTQILNQLLEGESKVYKVLGVGGKRQVIRRYEERTEESTLAEFFLVDGDFDDLLGRTCPDDEMFYRLQRYDIESFLVEEKAMSLIAEEERPRKTAPEYRQLFSVRRWEDELVNASLRLVACAALLEEWDDRSAAINQSIEQFVSGKEIIPDKVKIDAQINRVRNAQSIVECQEFDRLLNRMITRMGESFRERRRWISGKHIVLPLAVRLFRRYTQRNMQKESLCFRLAKSCEFPGLSELRDRLLALA